MLSYEKSENNFKEKFQWIFLHLICLHSQTFSKTVVIKGSSPSFLRLKKDKTKSLGKKTEPRLPFTMTCLDTEFESSDLNDKIMFLARIRNITISLLRTYFHIISKKISVNMGLAWMNVQTETFYTKLFWRHGNEKFTTSLIRL